MIFQVARREAMPAGDLQLRAASRLVRGVETDHRSLRSAWRAKRIQGESCMISDYVILIVLAKDTILSYSFLLYNNIRLLLKIMYSAYYHVKLISGSFFVC